jgi:hypothetical protein
MKKSDILRVWGRVLRGHTPFLSIEITKECPLRCPGCYAYAPDHLGPVTTLRQLSDYRGQDLVTAARVHVRFEGWTQAARRAARRSQKSS